MTDQRARFAQAVAEDINALFQLTAARRRLVWHFPFSIDAVAVSTHSRPKAAG